MPDGYSNHEDTYLSLIKIIGKDKLEDRFAFIMQTAYDFIRLSEFKEYFGVAKNIIQDIVIDYFSDIVRLKDFHDIDRINPIKIAAYTSYWVWRRHPIQQIKEFSEEQIKNKAFLSIMNEWYVFDLLVSMMYNKSVPFLLESSELQKWNDFTKNLVYSFTYRLITPHYLESVLIALRAQNCFKEK